MMVHFEIDSEDLPTEYRLLGIEVPENVAVTTVTQTALAKLSTGWSNDEHITRGHLVPWFDDKPTALASVPSVILPHSTNFLINPAHAEAGRITIVSDQRYPYDSRLMAVRAAENS